jgi:release factor glutamine methyltransferase
MRPFKLFSVHVLRPLVQRYLLKERNYCYHGACVKILPGVFHPALFFSTKFLLQFLEQHDLKEKKLLELGAGSGLISFIAEKRGAVVSASDLSETVIRGLQINRERLHSSIVIIRSDLFKDISPQPFDFIVINPPYYPHPIENESQLAWYCGEHFEYFEKLFSPLCRFVHPLSRILMVLSEDCDILTIRKIAGLYGFHLEEIKRKKFLWEWNFIFNITLSNPPERS